MVPVLLLAMLAAAAPPDFDREIAPLLSTHCTDCHSGPKPKGKLDLTRKAAAARVLPEEMWKRVVDDEMPPKKPLSAAEKAALKAWLDGGATWGSDPLDPFRFTTATRAGADWWSLQPIRRPAGDSIDHFVRAKLAEKGLTLSPEADRRTLIRRLTFDLIGLPPTPEEVEVFVKDPSPDAYEKVVDRLLASPHYGERWARHWLDVVRYGETNGFERNDARPSAWHYRDWVVRAFNADLPFDEFARLQIAGDVLKPGDPDGVEATGYLVAGVHNTVLPMNDVAMKTARQDELEDLVGNLGQAFLGLSVHCARCHDHKFDPIPQRDFYRVAAAVAGVTHGDRVVERPEMRASIERRQRALDRLERDLAAIEEPARRAVMAEKGAAAVGKLPPTPVAAWDFRDPKTAATLTAVGSPEFGPKGLTLDGKNRFARTVPLPFDLRAKTLEVWVRLGTLAQAGGGAFTVQTPDGAVFDAIVFAEKEPRRWMVGSNGFVRTKSFAGPEETTADRDAVHVAITYTADGTIAGYRDGKPYGTPYKSTVPATFAAGKFVAAFGIRHEPAGGNRMLAGAILQARLYDRALTADEVASSAANPGFATEAEQAARMSADDRAKRDRLRSEVAHAAVELQKAREAARVKVYTAVPQAPPVTRLLVRGQVTDATDVISPGGVGVLPGAFTLPDGATDGERRKRLAEWVTHPANPLFARVIANRVWHYHFGTGLVETPSDFGFNGGRPSHPELLDYLASVLRAPRKPRDGRPWALKPLHRLIVTSATYKQFSVPRADALALDADSRLLWRKKPQRLEAEAVRDAMLATAGLLNRTVGGAPFSDYKASGDAGTIFYDPIDPAGPAFHRRSLYRFVPRGGNPGLLDAFDCPDPAGAAPRRASTTTPLQALSLWNGPFALRMSEAFAARVAAAGDVGKQVREAYRIAFQREPTADEVVAARALVEKHGLRALTRGLLNANEFLTVD